MLPGPGSLISIRVRCHRYDKVYRMIHKEMMMVDPNGLIPSAGLKMPWILYGTAWKKERTRDLVIQAIQTGFRGLDTACQPKHYNEPQVGEALEHLKGTGIDRDEIFLQTKFTPLAGQDPQRIPYDQNAPVELQVAQSFEVSQRNLRTKTIDSLVLHSPLSPHELLMQAWGAMEKIVATGSVKQLGISNCYDLEVLKRLYRDATVKPAVIQNRFHQRTGYDSDLRQWCSQHQVIYQSFWTLTANPHILDSSTIQTKAQTYQQTPVQILFRYLNQVGIVPLTGTNSVDHMSEDLNVFDFELSARDLAEIGALLKK